MVAIAVAVSVSIRSGGGGQRRGLLKSTNLDRLHASDSSHCGNGWGCCFGGGIGIRDS